MATRAVAIGETGEADVEGDEESAKAAVSTWAAWWQAARWPFLSLLDGPRWRGRREVEEVGGEGGGRDGVGGTWVSKGAVETNGDKTITGGEVESGFASMGPDREKLCH